MGRAFAGGFCTIIAHMIKPTPSAPEIPAIIRNDHFNALDVSRPIFHQSLYNEIKIGKKRRLEALGQVHARKA
jgi:hypothetical protein